MFHKQHCLLKLLKSQGSESSLTHPFSAAASQPPSQPQIPEEGAAVLRFQIKLEGLAATLLVPSGLGDGGIQWRVLVQEKEVCQQAEQRTTPQAFSGKHLFISKHLQLSATYFSQGFTLS